MSIHHHSTIDNIVRTSESEIKHGNIDAFAQQIAQLPESERQQIATRIKQDFAKAGANGSLPELSFSDSGTLKRSHSREKYAETERTYANNGHKVVEDFHRLDGKFDSRDVYADNGKLQSNEINQNGRSQVETYDAAGKLTSREVRDSTGDFIGNKFNSRGNLTESTMINGADHSGGTVTYDPNTGRSTFSNSIDHFGYKIHYEFDSRTGKPSSWSGSAADGTTAVASFDADGNVLNYHQLTD